MNTSFFIFSNGVQSGPYSYEMLAMHFRSGRFSSADLVYDDASSQWVELAMHPELQVLVDPTYVPPPPASEPPPAVHVPDPAPPVVHPAVPPVAHEVAESTQNAPLPVASDEPTDEELRSVMRPRPRKASPWKKIAALLGLFVLVAAGAAAGYFGYREFMASRDLASLLPPGARLYMELDLRAMDDARRKVIEDYIAFVTKAAELKGAIPPIEQLAGRYAVAVYGTAELQGTTLGVIVIGDASPEAFAAVDGRVFTAAGLPDATTRDLQGWAIQESRKTGIPMGGFYLGMARKGRIFLVASSQKVMEDCINLVEGSSTASLAASDAFRNAFPGEDLSLQDPEQAWKIVQRRMMPGAGPAQRVFLDLKGIVADVHPFLSIAGGDSYAQIKRDFLDPLQSLTLVGGPDGDNNRSVMRIRLDPKPAWLDGLAAAKLEWPEGQPKDVDMFFDMALPQEWKSAISGLMAKAGNFGAKATLGQVHGVFGSLNGALAMSYADSGGGYPIARADTPIENLGIVPRYMAEVPRTPWGSSYLYQGDGTAYTLSVGRDSAMLTWYSSAEGRVQTAPDADAILSSQDGMTPERAEELLAGIAEVVMAGSNPDGSPWMMSRRQDSTKNMIFALRMRKPEDAADAAKLIALFSRNTPQLACRAQGAWLLLGDTATLDAVGTLPVAAPGEPGFTRSTSRLDLSRVLPESYREGLPSVHAWTSLSRGTVQEGVLVLDTTVAPDATPIILGALLPVVFGWNHTSAP